MALSTTDVTLWYDLEEGTGNTLDNAEGTSSRDGTNSGAVWTTGGPTNISKALDFDGSNFDRILLNNTLTDLSLTSFSVSMWLKLDNASSNQYLWNDWGGSPNRSVYLRQLSNKMEFYISDNGTSSELQLDPALTNTSTYVHVVLTRDGNDTELIFNGSSVDTNTGSFTLPASATDLVFGCNPAGDDSPFDGKLAQLAILNKALTTTEAGEIYNSGDGITYNNLFNPGVVFIPKVMIF